jgi:23S rRNA (adenine2503-C2)-methyltransferase
MEIKKFRKFRNGVVYALALSDGKLIETTDTFLPYYTKDAIGRKQNMLKDTDLGDRTERWMIGVSTMSGCPCKCKFCATGNMKSKYRNLTADEIVEQVMFAVEKAGADPSKAKEFKINYTRMGEPFLNIDNVKEAIRRISEIYPNTHHYVSTIGIKGSDFSFIKGNITLQISLHSFDEKHRDWLIPFKNKMSIEELGQIRTESNLKTTINMTLVDENDYNAELLRKYFDPKYFFVKLSPINPNEVSKENGLDEGIIKGINLA